ncbi:MAG: UDP-2,3-diacylglucosamine diphosphatase [Polaromonas sp.]|uniref:UDP-2,3-diacylglucosamine diphosphatase n=1 Tax=Polaromonas sp. TaxID=1869339 RepID=UPI0027373CF0|nr:UDP-2,3-diacylglucosamine diphosphatase [Polaromonas sp.]MDP2818303.1 UDP-2,3-diacylglucosamine diphosphatase [Polaromonas sp.]
MTPTVPQIAELVAPAAWRTVDFISDIHLKSGEPANFAAWQAYMQSTPADAVFILGDLFDVWVGDDAAGHAASDFDASCVHVLQNTGERLALFFMHGNRDFLVGPELMARCRSTLLADPTVLGFAGSRWLLSHGDALCLDDVDYMHFRKQVRRADWQQAFLGQPLPERQAIARGLRRQSREQHEKRGQSGEPYIDLNADAARLWLQAANAPTLIHGHTHQPAVHALGPGLERVVLSDWDATAQAPRAEVLRLSAAGLQRITLA